MEYRYFKGDLTQEPLKTIREAWLKLREDRNQKLDSIFDTMPFYNSWYGCEESIYGIVCDDDNPALEEVKNTKGYKIERIKNRNVIKPDRRYKTGKVLAEKLDQCRQILQNSPSFSKYTLKELSMTCWVGYGKTLYIAVAGIANGQYIAKVPVKGEHCDCDDFPTIPEFLTEIKESEFLAIQGK